MVHNKKAFRPRHGNNNHSFLPLPATFSRINQRKKFPVVLIGALLIWFFFNPFTFFSSLFTKPTIRSYSPPHPYSSDQLIETQSRFIYPPVEHADSLKQLGISKLVLQFTQAGSDKTELKPLAVMDDPDVNVQKAKEEEQNAKDILMNAKNHFKNQDKVVYRPKSLANYPDVVIVTAIDFNKYSLDGLTKIVQNRVDYAYHQKYGVYVRWAAEFIPQLGSMGALNEEQKAKWVRLFCLQAARLAFPHTKWFWYLDENALLMDMSISIDKILLSPESLNKQMLRDQPLIPPHGLIKTYKSTKAEGIKLIVTQSDKMIETNSFFVKNDAFGKALIEIWSDPLYKNYPSFPHGPDSALTHMLQWHPFVLSKTAIVRAKLIAASHDTTTTTNNNNNNKNVAKSETYENGDLVAQWSSCKGSEECEAILNVYSGKKSKNEKV
ncbi:uncharacterized protein LODBEIA_P27890 [Lodderomyces beijingensis]|uniref:Uncharacterized protein n=1 Tax=Lodderomyces beijingensis TaxID=1775926 RepID=A0ABP0ZQS9_9ASCO